MKLLICFLLIAFSGYVFSVGHAGFRQRTLQNNNEFDMKTYLYLALTLLGAAFTTFFLSIGLLLF